MEVGIIDDLPVPMLLGRDCPGFDQLMAASFWSDDRGGRRHRRQQLKPGEHHPVLLAMESQREGKCSDPNLFSELFQQVTGEGSFGKEQREDDGLQNCWNQVRKVEEEVQIPGPHPLRARGNGPDRAAAQVWPGT